MLRGNHVFVAEEVCAGSGISESISICVQKHNRSCRVHGLDLGKNFVTHGHIKCLYHQTGLDSESIADYMSEVLRHEN